MMFRDHRGRFLPNLRETPEGSCEFLIWSRYHGAWHRRSPEGDACGYTRDIAEAGLFPRSVAFAYNSHRDRPYHVSEKRAEINAAIEVHDRKLANLRRALAAATGTAKTAKRVECEASQSGGDSRNAQKDKP